MAIQRIFHYIKEKITGAIKRMNNEEKNLKNQESVTTDGTEKVTIITGNTDVSEDCKIIYRTDAKRSHRNI